MQIRKFFAWSITLALLIAVPGLLFSGTTGKIAGKVSDPSTGDPLPGVNIVLVGTVMGAATDADGYYFIINVPPGAYELEASMIGYETTRQTNIRVTTDHTTPVNFELKQTVIAGTEVTVVAEREVVQMDMSASQISSTVEEINEVPLVRDVREFINLQAGVENDLIRGGGLDQTQFMVDGLAVVDNRTNQPVQMVNLSAIKEISIIKGGFNAEYGNLRSGLINVVTKEPSGKLTGSLDFRVMPATQKHGGYSIFDPMNFWLRPYLDDAVAWTGTSNGAWDEYTQQQYKSFPGWNAVADGKDFSPQDAQNAFKYLHRIPGINHPGGDGSYADAPDWKVDASLGGSVPVVGKYLGNMNFFASFSNNREQWALPASTDHFNEYNGMLKLISKLSTKMKLSVDWMYGETSTIARQLNGDTPGYLNSGSDVFWRSEDRVFKGEAMYYPGVLNPYTVYRNVAGISFDHVLSPSTFYQVRASYLGIRDVSGISLAQRNPAIVRTYGSIELDEAPYGVTGVPGPYDDQMFTRGGEEIQGVKIVGPGSGPKLMEDGMYYGAHSAGARDFSKSYAWNFKFDLTSQVDKYNQAKIGFLLDYDDIYTYVEKNRWESTWENWYREWHHFPWRFGAYVQDKLEFQGMIANLGFRMDYNAPNSNWFNIVDPYSKWYKAKYKGQIFDQKDLFSDAKGKLKISPRLGISHPISANAKLYFNYGHFYSMPSSASMYEIRWGRASRSIERIGNPSLEIPKTVAYELGWEYNLNDMFLFHVSGYYKDVTDQPRNTQYTSFDGQVDYQTYEARQYEDIRGFEIRIDKRFGRWVTGWINYNYIVNTSGYVGRQHYYEDPREQRIYGLENPYQEVPEARPYARASILFSSPRDFGPDLGGIKPLANVRLNTLFRYKAGRYETWDPLDTKELKNNIQWESSYTFDFRLSKFMRMSGMNFEVFMDVNNLFDSYVFSNQSFYNSDDHDRYMESLHLPLYKEPGYEEYEGGSDKPGMTRDDKNYINDPNLGYLMNLNPRTVWFGIRFDF